MSSTRTLARVGGLLYLIVAVCGGFSQLFVRSSVRMPGDGAATAANIAAHATLFRIGFVSDLVAFACFLAVGLVMYALFKPVSPYAAVTILVLNAVSVAISALNMLNQLAALMIATDPAYTAGWTAQASHSLVLLLMDVQQQGYLIAQIFFGLFLAPLGYAVYRSGLLPKALGIVLAVGAGGYLADIAITYLSDGLQSQAGTDFGMIGGLAEMVFLAWLLIAGVRSPAARIQTSVAVAP